MQKQIKDAVAGAGPIYKRAMFDATTIVKNKAQTLVPYKTGALRRSIFTTVNINPLKGVVGVSEKYGPFVEYGTGIYATGPGGSNARKIPWVYKSKNGFFTTSGQKPQPYMRPTKEQTQDQVKQIFRDAVELVTRKAAGQ